MKNILFKIGILTSPFLFLLVVVGQAKAEPYGWSPSVDNSWQGPPTCTGDKPKAPVLFQPNHPLLLKAKGKGQIRLQWFKVPGGTDYIVYYGLSPRNYIFSVPSTGDTDNFTVGWLANRVYYFAVQAKKGCMAGPLSNEWPGRPGAGVYPAGYRSTAVLGVGTGVVPVRQTYRPPASGTTVYIPSATPTTVSEVKGVTYEPTQPPTYQPPRQTTRSFVPTPTPKPASFWQKLLSIFFGK